MNDKLASQIRDFYLCLIAVGFQPDEALAITLRHVPEMQEVPVLVEPPEPINVGIDWGVGKSYTAPVARKGTVPRKSKEEIEDALDTLIEAIGVFGHRMDSPVSLIFGNGFALTETTKDLNTKQYRAGTSQVRDWIYENQKGK